MLRISSRFTTVNQIKYKSIIFNGSWNLKSRQYLVFNRYFNISSITLKEKKDSEESHTLNSEEELAKNPNFDKSHYYGDPLDSDTFKEAQEQAKKKSTSELFMENLINTDKSERSRLKELEKEEEDKYDIPMWLGFLLVLILAIRYAYQRNEMEEKYVPPSYRVYSDTTMSRLKKIPTRTLSQWWGSFAATEHSPPIQDLINKTYAYVTGCNLDEAEKDITDYKSLSDFFTRRLKQGIRPINQDALLVSPVDGRICHFGVIDAEASTHLIEQVKGVNFQLKDLVGADSPLFTVLEEQKNGDRKTKLYYCTIYLAPYDYHGYHSPVNWEVEQSRHIPGYLFPVAQWATQYMKGLFSFNERIVVTGKWEHGFFSFIPVGAYNVGSMSLSFDTNLKTNKPSQTADSPLRDRFYTPSIPIEKGSNIGFFNMGSTVVLIYESPPQLFMKPRGGKVKLGETLSVILTPELAAEQMKRLERRHKIIQEQFQAELEARNKEELETLRQLDLELEKRKKRKELEESIEHLKEENFRNRVGQFKALDDEEYKRQMELATNLHGRKRGLDSKDAAQ